MTLLYGPDGKPVQVETKPIQATPAKVTRQMKRAYLRTCATSVINQKAGGEPRAIRRDMALTLAKRSSFIEEVRQATGAF